jgi:hypothetical protein
VKDERASEKNLAGIGLRSESDRKLRLNGEREIKRRRGKTNGKNSEGERRKKNWRQNENCAVSKMEGRGGR